MNLPLKGILPALVTPLHDDLTLDVSALEKLLAHVYGAGCHGVYVCGSTGEGQLLDAATRRRIVEIAADHTPSGRQMIVHVGAWSPRESQELARHAEQHGAAAISCLRPQNTSFPETLAHYRALAAVTALPFLAYYFPAQAGGTMSLNELQQLCALPGIVGLKFTDYDLFTLSLLVRQGKTVFHGRDEMLVAGFLMGACGGIGSIYNIVPEWFVKLYDLSQEGRWAAARELQDRINDLIRVLVSFPFMPALKRTLDWQGLRCGPALAPRMPLTAQEDARLIAALEALPGLPKV